MRSTVRVWMIIPFSIIIWALQFNIVTDMKASQYLKNELEIALHDAGLQLKRKHLAEGLVVYDRDIAYDAFVTSLELNTKLNNMKPTRESFFEDEFNVVVFDIQDDTNTSSYPMLYTHPDYQIDTLITGPSIITVVETYGPRYFRGAKNVIRRTATYTYEKNE